MRILCVDWIYDILSFQVAPNDAKNWLLQLGRGGGGKKKTDAERRVLYFVHQDP